jgi:O-antigen/teichoic acid export membrane protein
VAGRNEFPRTLPPPQGHLLRRALPLGVAALAVGIYYSVDALLLGILRSSAEVAYYAVAYRVVTPLLVLPVIGGTVALPTLARASAVRPASAVPVLKTLSTSLLCLGLPAAAGTAIVAKPLVEFAFGRAYFPAALPLALLIWSIVAVYANAPFAYLMIARGQHREYMIATLGGAVVNTVLNLILIPGFGVIGAAVATIVTEVIVAAIIVWWTRDVAPPLLVGALWLAGPATCLMAVLTWPFRGSLLAIPVGLLTYSAAFLTSLAFRSDGRRALGALLRRFQG